MVVTIDGPAAAGKSTVAKRLARELSYVYLNTGAMYRAVTYEALRRGLDMNDPESMAALARSLTIEFHPSGDQSVRVLADGRDVTEHLWTPEVTARIYLAADKPAVRAALNEKQRRFAQGRDIVTEGRDQGTEVFPNAEVKFYLYASPEVRAERRMRDYHAGARPMTYPEVLKEVLERDEKDKTRPVGALRKTPDAIVVDTSHMSIEEVVQKLAAYVREKLGNAHSRKPQPGRGGSSMNI